MNQPKKVLNDARARMEWNRTCTVRDYVIDPNTLSIMRRILPDEKFSEYKNANEEIIFFSTPIGSTAVMTRDEAKELLAASQGIEGAQFSKHRTLKIGPKGYTRTLKLNSQGLSYQSKTGSLIHIISSSFRSGWPSMGNYSWGKPMSIDDAWARLRVALGKFINSEPMGETIPLIETNIMVFPLLNREAGAQTPIIVVASLDNYRTPSSAIKIYGGEPGEGLRITPAPTPEGGLEITSTIKLWCDAINDIAENPENAPKALRLEKGPLFKRMEYINTAKWWGGSIPEKRFRIVMNGDYSNRATKWSFIHDSQFIKDLIKALTNSACAIDALPSREGAIGDGYNF